MQNLDSIFLSPSATLIDAIGALENHPHRFLCIADRDRVLLGTVTDGDIRRALIRSQSLTSTIDVCMNRKPIFLQQNYSDAYAQKLMTENVITAIPVVNDAGTVVDVVFASKRKRRFENNSSDNLDSAMIMAGGLGKRMRPLTENIPKSLAPLNGKPILEHQINAMIDCGIRKIIISVNFLSDQIKNFCDSKDNFGIEIEYVEEERFLGTAGSLSLAKDFFISDFLLINCDVISSLSFEDFFDFHQKSGSDLSLASVKFEQKIEYGVLALEGSAVRGITEKPKIPFNVAAGVYVISDAILGLIEYDTPCDMPDLIKTALFHGYSVNAFDINGYWSDVGSIEQLLQTEKNFSSFKV